MRIVAIINPEVKTGYNKKGQQWTQMMVELDNKQQVRIFAPAEVGQEVEAVKNGDFTNYNVVKGGSSSATGDEVMKGLQAIYTQNQEILKKVSLLLGETEPSTAPTSTPAPVREQSGYESFKQAGEGLKKDQVYDLDGLPVEMPGDVNADGSFNNAPGWNQ